MKLHELIQPSDVVADLRAKDKRRAIEALADHAALALGLDGKAIAASLFKREALGSTGMGTGTAIPHARMAEVARPFGMFARLHSPVPFDAIDAQPVDILCLLLLPNARQEEGPSLRALACVARAFRDAELLALIRRAPPSPEFIFGVLLQSSPQTA